MYWELSERQSLKLAKYEIIKTDQTEMLRVISFLKLKQSFLQSWTNNHKWWPTAAQRNVLIIADYWMLFDTTF